MFPARRSRSIVLALMVLVAVGTAVAALVAPTDIQQPGTQPQEIGNLESLSKCDNCHAGYDAMRQRRELRV